jgi:BirA family biotin operon repressor/biotin-[acetyl-CoA-carboxylase] ligase
MMQSPSSCARFPLGVPIVRIGETESTNDIARALAACGVPEGAVVVADRQTKGRGRLGRSWVSPPGGLWCSLLLRPAGSAPAGLLSLAVGVAAAEAIEAATGVVVDLKWPNDLVIRRQKVGGILIEGGAALIVGVGINVNVPAGELPQDAPRSAASLHMLAGRTLDGAKVLDALLDRTGRWYGVWRAGGPGIIEAWRLRDATIGTPVVVSTSGQRLEGLAAGIADDGALMLRLAGGEIRRVLAGDLHPGGMPWTASTHRPPWTVPGTL